MDKTITFSFLGERFNESVIKLPAVSWLETTKAIPFSNNSESSSTELAVQHFQASGSNEAIKAQIMSHLDAIFKQMDENTTSTK